MALTRIPSSLVANTFTANTVLFANGLGYLSNTSNFKYFSGNNTIAVGAVVAGGIDVISYTQAAFNAANAAGSSAYVQSAYDQANTATGIAQAAFNSANNVAPQVQPAFDKANSANVLAQSAYNSSNAVNQYAASGYALANTNATNITLVNQFAQSGYNQANTATGIAQAAFNSANNVAPQVQPAYDKANVAYTLAQSAYNSSNAVNQYAAFGYALANTNATNITLVNQFTQSAYNAANAAGSSAYVQSAFDKANSANSLAQSAYNAANTALSGNTIQYLTVSKQTYTATAGQTSFAVTYTPGLVTLVINGSTIDSSEYTATNGSAIVLNNAASLNDIVDITGFVSANTISSAFTGPQGNTGPAGPLFTGNTTYQLITTNTQNAISTSTGALIVYGGAGISGNVYSNKIYTDGIFYSANGLPFQMGSPDLTDNWARQQANTNNLAIVAVNQYAMSAYYNGNLNATSITSVNQYAASAYNTANLAYNTANSASSNTIYNNGVNVTQNTNIIYSTAIAGYAWNTANNAHLRLDVGVGTQATQNTRLDGIEGTNLTQNTNITTANNAAWAAYAAGNTNATNITAVNNFAQSAYNTANTKFNSSGGNITGSVTISGNNDLTVTGNLYLTGTQFVSNTQSFVTQDPLLVLGLGNYTSDAVDIGFASHYNDGANAHTGLIRDYGTKEYYFFKGYTPELDTNNNVNINHASFSTANVNAGYFRGNVISRGYDVLDFAQAAYNSANNVAPQVQPAFDKANTASSNTVIIQGVDLTQNTRINSIETINNNQNTTIAIIQGVDLTQNTRLDGVEGTNLTQNTNITTANNAAWAAYAAGNTNSTNITYVNQFAQSAYNAANAAGSSAYVQAAFDKANNALANTSGTFAGNLTTTGNVKVSSTQAATSTTTGALTVSGGVGVSGNLYAGNIYTNGALINNSAALTVYKYVATAGQTTFSGSDSNALTLSYVASAIFVTLNGVVLNNTLEYTATNGTSVVLGTAAELDDELNIYSFGAFQIADAYTSAQADSRFLTQANAITGYVSTANGTAINQFAAGAYTNANGANGLAAGAFALANTASANTIITQGIDNTQNTNITTANNAAWAAFASSNTKIASITGTSNQIIVTGTTTPTLSTPQDIGTASNVQHGSLGIGTAASGTAGEIRASNNITGYYSSDRKYKENIIDIPDALNKVDAIGGKMFDWTDSYIQEHGGEDGYFVQKRDFGVIAQDVQAVFPEAVRTREDGSLAVDYSKLSALAFAAIVELKKEIEQLKNNK